LLQTTRQPNHFKEPNGSFNVARSSSVPLVVESTNRRQEYIKEWSFTEDHHLGILS